ncbi:MAG: hypothetical protein IPO75_02085 [Betaproteobacteria bacterium]|nr:hypothetical protein [Betaproteobacteria bacterium]
MIPQLSPADLVHWRADPTRPAPLLVDVREPWEFDVCHIAGSLHVPLGQLPPDRADPCWLPRPEPAANWLRAGFPRHNRAASPPGRRSHPARY